ncbi:hypothetical protein SeseC_01338 [Streptococcus equi subsp. zooepidemicus ATCC 35246]|nr:hypothetical protein SeseC_01338 [Streptococcus equi subsp. zooepidemicus ATCC 35246]
MSSISIFQEQLLKQATIILIFALRKLPDKRLIAIIYHC